MIISQLIVTALYPFLVSGMLGLLLFLILKGENSKKAGVAGLALAAGYAMGFTNIVGFGHFPPILVNDWLPYSAIGAWLVFLFLNRARLRVTLLLALVWILIWLWLYLSPLLSSRSLADIAPVALIAGACWLGLWWAWESSCRKEPEGFDAWIVMVVSATGVSLISVLDGSAKLGQLGGSFAASCGALLLVRLFFPFPLGSAMRAVYLTLLGGGLLLANVYAEVSPFAVFLLVLTGLTITLRNLPVLAKRRPFIRSLALLALSALPTIIAILYLIQTATHDDYGY